MDRRTYLGRCAALGVAVAVAGCTDQTLEDAKDQPPVFDDVYDESSGSLPVEDEFDVVAAGIERADGVTLDEPAALEEFLVDAGIAVEHLAEAELHGDTVLELEHVVGETISEGNGRSMGIVAGGYTALVRGGYDGDELSASLLDPDGRTFGEYEVLTDWAEEYDAGGITAAVYASEVLHTLESAR